MFNLLFNLLVNGGTILGIFVILLLNSRGVKKSRANLFLSILLGALTFSVAHSFYAGHVIRLISHSGNGFFMGDPTFLIIAPLLWFYTVELTGGRIRLTGGTLLQFAPFVLICIFSLTFPHFRDSALVRYAAEHPKVIIVIYWAIVVVQFSWYVIRIHQKWQAYQQAIRQEVSNPEHVNISWIRYFTILFLIVTLFMVFGLFAVIHMDYGIWLWQAAAIVFSISIFALGFRGILQKEIFHNEPVMTEIATAPDQKTSFDQQAIVKLKDFMETNRPFLDPDLSLSGLSKSMNMARGQLSLLINDGLGENFYDFINKYRVEEVKRLMADPKMQHFNLLGIALEAGFKSKSTFNLTFKRFTGLTPTEYRRNITKPDVQ